MTAIKFNTAFVGIMSAISLYALAGKVSLSGRGGAGSKKNVDYNLEKNIYKSQPFIIFLKG